MGRYVSIPIETSVYYGIRDIKPGYGSGSFRFYGVSGTFTVPSGVSEVRITALGGGGIGSSMCCLGSCCHAPIGGGGGGAGYVVATVPVVPGCTCNVAVGAAGSGTSCFGTVVYAYGGGAGSSCTPGCAGNFCACTGSTLIVGRNGNTGCTGLVCNDGNGNAVGANVLCGRGGASGSPIGGAGTGPFPGTSGADVYNCKGFNGEDTAEADIASKFGNQLRWPGEAILGTSRAASAIAGTAAGYPNATPYAYCVTAFGGGGNACGCCTPAQNSPNNFMSAGFGGGSAGCRANQFCFISTGYQNCPGCFGECCCARYTRGCAGSGFVVVEF